MVTTYNAERSDNGNIRTIPEFRMVAVERLEYSESRRKSYDKLAREDKGTTLDSIIGTKNPLRSAGDMGKPRVEVYGIAATLCW
jgi:hypothetical protein